MPPVGDTKSEEIGSGARYNDSKPAYDLLPMHLLEEVCHVWEYGAEKYAAWNWAKGMRWTIPYACICRHLFAWFRGEDNDTETGYSHLAHVICNVLMLIHYKDFYPEGDDRPRKYFYSIPRKSP